MYTLATLHRQHQAIKVSSGTLGPRPPRTGDHGRLRSHCVDGKQAPRQECHNDRRRRRRPTRPHLPGGDSHRVYVIGGEKSDRERGAAAHAVRLCIEREEAEACARTHGESLLLLLPLLRLACQSSGRCL